MCAQMIRGHRQARKTPPTTKPMNRRWMTTTTSASAWYHMVSAHDAQRDLAVAAVLLDQREPQRQQGSGCREQRPAVELRRADPVHRVDHHLARQRRALLVHNVRHGLARD